MDPVALQCKKKLESFRIKELKDVLSRIGAGKQGKKQMLVDRIMAIILTAERGPFNPMGLKLESLSARYSKSREDVAKAIDDVYRLRRFGAPDLATRIEYGNINGIGNVPVGSFGLARQSKHNGLPHVDSRTRCPCGSTMESGTMIQCEAPSCLAWQHVNCVIVPEKEDLKPEIPTNFFCEICRIQHGDPFCVSVAHPLMPNKTTATIVYAPEGGSSILQNLEASFMLTRNDRELLHNPVFDLQIWCVLLGDEVAFRMHWPLKADLRVNGDFVRVTNRPGQQKLGANGRDDGPVITDLTREGLNRVSFTAHDGRNFCLGVRIIQRLTMDQVMSSIPSESQGESFDMALSRVRRCIGGGGGGALGDDSDSDLEVVSEWVTVNLRCPMSGSRMKVAGRFKPCVHMACFDLHTFVELNQRARKWQCPICLKNYSLKDLIIDPFFTQITRALKSYDEDVSEVEMKPDGCWRPKLDEDSKVNESWRSPVGLISLAHGVNSSEKVLNSVKVEEGLSVERVPLKMGFKRTQDGSWKVNGTLGPADLTMSNMMRELNHQAVQNGAKSLYSTATASNGFSSINQEPMEFFNPFGGDEVEVTSSSVNAPANVFPNSLLGGELDEIAPSDVIVLSDTEEDYSNTYNLGAEGLRSFPTNSVEVQENDEGRFLNFERDFTHGVSETAVPFAEVGSFQRNATVALDFFGTNRGALVPTSAQEDSWQRESYVGPFDFFSAVPDVPTVSQSSHVPNHSTLQAHEHSREMSMLETTSIYHNGRTQRFEGQDNQNLGTEGTNGLVAPDSSLRDFLPHQPARSAATSTGHVPQDCFTDDMQNGWFSLSLGGSESFPNAAAPLYDSSHQRTHVNTLDDSVLHDLSNYGTHIDGSTLTSKVTKGSTITHPPQYQKAYFCVDSDSD